MIKLASTSIILILLISCGTNVKKVHTNYSPKSIPKQCYIDQSKLKSWDVALNTIGYDGASLANTMNQANMNTAASAGGSYSPGAGLVGALIGGAITKSIIIAETQSRANKPVGLLLSKLESFSWDSLFQEDVELDNHTFEILDTQPKHEVIKVIPDLEITSNYQSIELHAYVEIRNPKNRRKPRYANYFHIQSPSIVEEDMILGDLNQHSVEYVCEKVDSMLTVLFELIIEELTPDTTRPAVQSIRFENHMGKYYERGRILKKEDGYITFKSLRGEIKHYPYEEQI